MTDERAPGPAHAFAAVHIFRALELIRKKLIGRSRLSREMALGEGATRTLIERLKEKGFITVERAGCTLTEKGEEFWEAFQDTFPRKAILERSKLTLGPFNVALLVKGGAGKVKSGMEQRDAALIAGAKGATTLICKDGRLTVPPEQRDVAKDFPRVHRALIKLLRPGENDAIIIGSADTLEKAEYGSLAAAISLINDSDNA